MNHRPLVAAFFIAFLGFALGARAAEPLAAEHAIRWNPADGGPKTAADVWAKLGLPPGEESSFEIRYLAVPAPALLPQGFKVIVRERQRLNKKRHELTYKLRGPAPLPQSPSLNDWVCPVGADSEKKDEVDVSFFNRENPTRSFSRSCTVESKEAPPAVPASLRTQPGGCKSTMVRLKLGQLKVEEWHMPGGQTLIEVSQTGVDAPQSLKEFGDGVAKVLVDKHQIRPVDASKTELGSDCPAAAVVPAKTTDCTGSPLSGVGGVKRAWQLSGSGVAAFAKMNINIDGYGRAYHPENAKAGALIHLCNAGRVVLPDGTQYEGSESNATCTGKFMSDVKRIGQAGWRDASVGAVQWYGILGQGSVTINGKKIDAVTPVLNKDGSGFYVSPTSLVDKTVSDPADQSRYVNPVRIAAAVIPKSLAARGIAMGSFGVAMNVKKRIAVPFVVGDGGPRIGEGSLALARLAAGVPLTDHITRADRFVGQVDQLDVLWVFFGGEAATYDSKNESALTAGAQAAFERWGGEARLTQCAAAVPRN